MKENKRRRKAVPPCDIKDCFYYDKILRFGDNRYNRESQYREIECLQCKHFIRDIDNYKRR